MCGCVLYAGIYGHQNTRMPVENLRPPCDLMAIADSLQYGFQLNQFVGVVGFFLGRALDQTSTVKTENFSLQSLYL